MATGAHRLQVKGDMIKKFEKKAHDKYKVDTRKNLLEKEHGKDAKVAVFPTRCISI